MLELAPTERAHAVLAPSSMKMFLNCQASLLDMELKQEQEESIYAAEGTLAHDYVQQILAAGTSIDRAKILTLIEDMEMREHVANFCHTVESVLSKIGPENIVEFKVEERVRYSKHVYGTVDVIVLYVRNGKKSAYLFDFKYGKGIPVFAQDNAQLLTYLIAAIKHFNYPVERATLAIYQPRNSANATALDQWVVESADIAAFEKTIKTFEKKALKILDGSYTKNIEEVPGDHCTFCHRKPICRGIATYASVPGMLMLTELEPLPLLEHVSEVKTDKKGKLKDITIREGRLSDEQIDVVLRKADFIVKWVKAVQKYAAGRFASGHALSGWKLVEGRKTRKWLPDEDKVISELLKLGLKEPFTLKLKNITDVEKELGLGKEELSGLTTFNAPKPKLVPDEDPRPAITNALDLLSTLDSDEDDE